MKRIGAVLVMALALVVSCDDDPGEPKPGQSQPFSFGVTVNNPAGTPVSGVSVAVWNDLSFPFPSPPKKLGATSTYRPAVSIRFDLAQNAEVIFEILDMAGNVCRTLIDTTRPQGFHTVVWDGRDDNGDVKSAGVYEFRLRVFDTGNTTPRYEGSVLASLHTMSENVIGFTNASGRMSANDKLLFPNLLTLPSQIIVGVAGNELGLFTYEDSITIAVRDTATSQVDFYRRRVTSSANAFTLVFDPGPAPVGPAPGASVSPADVREAGPQPTDRLYHPFPNPFN